MSSQPSLGGEHGRPEARGDFSSDGVIDLRELSFRLLKGITQIVAFTLLGLALAASLSFVVSRVQPVSTITRVTLSFAGFEKGQYPDKSKFQPDDLRSPALIEEALRRLSYDTSSDFQSRVRGALGIEAIIPANIVKERDRLRASGQTPPAYVPDEYVLSLTLKPSTAFSNTQRERLLTEIISVYRENFYRTYGQLPLAFGTAFDTLKNADFAEYETVLNSEISSIKSYLMDQIEVARSFRSRTTNLSFKDLSEQTDLFAQIQLNELLGLIRENGLSRNRATAMLKLNYYLRQLDERELKAVEEEKLVRDLLAHAQQRTSNYILGTKGQTPAQRPDLPVLDQGLIDSLLANDSYNFLVRRALDAGLEVKRVQAEKNRLISQRDNLKAFLDTPPRDQSEIMAQATDALTRLDTAYQALIDNIRKTHLDFSRQEYADSIRITDEIRTPGFLRSVVIAGFVGGVIAFAVGAGLSLLGVYIGRKNPA